VPTAAAAFTIEFVGGGSLNELLGSHVGKMTGNKTFTGDISGTSVVEMLSVGNDERSLAYVAIERFTVSIAGRTGSFVMQHLANFNDGRTQLTYLVIEGAGTGDFAGIRGEGRIDIDDAGAHTLTLDYDVA
jgi:hypothetical protein